MKHTIVRISFTIFAALFIAVGQHSLYAQDKEGLGTSFQSANRIVGAWETTVTPRNCETGEQVGPPFNGLLTFNEGGTIAEYAANPAAPHRSPGHGIWVSTGSSTYTMRFSFISLTPTGVPVGRMRVSQLVELSRFSDESSSSGTFVLTSFSGVVLASGCTTSTAVRLQL